MKPSLSGRADLIRALAFDDPELSASMAELLGYHDAPVALRKLTRLPVSSSQRDLGTPAYTQYEPADVPF